MKHSFPEQINAIKEMMKRLTQPLYVKPRVTELNPEYLKDCLNDAASSIASLNLTKELPTLKADVLHITVKDGYPTREQLLEKALKSTRQLNLHLYEEGTIGNRVFKEINDALNTK